MPKDEIQCDRCQDVLHISQYSKSQRKQDDPMCLRCVAWGETQQYGVVPAPLATGHVSMDETHGEVWAGHTRMTDEDFYKPQAPISSRDALGLEGEGSGQYSNAALQGQWNSTVPPLEGSEAGSVVSASTARQSAVSHLPPHLRSRGASSTSSASGGSVTKSLPPHLRGTVGSSNASISTATTVRDARNEEKASRNVEFNAWSPSGNMVSRTRQASTIASKTSTRNGSTSSSTWPETPAKASPHRQVDVNPVPPPGAKTGKKNFPKAKPVAEDSYLAEWPEPTW